MTVTDRERPRLAVVIFDLDDTLVDHTGAAREGARRWLSALGVEPSAELLEAWFAAERRYFSLFDRGEVTDLEQRRLRQRAMLRRLGRSVPDDRELDRRFAVYLDAYAAAWHAFADVPATLDRVRAHGLRIAVLTNGSLRLARGKLERTGLAEHVEALFCPETLRHHKPDQRAFTEACTALAIPPARVLMVGDRYELDVAPALAAGLHALHLDRTAGAGGDGARATATSGAVPARRIGSLRELPALL